MSIEQLEHDGVIRDIKHTWIKHLQLLNDIYARQEQRNSTGIEPTQAERDINLLIAYIKLLEKKLDAYIIKDQAITFEYQVREK